MQRQFDIVATLALIGSVLCWSTVPLFLKYFTHFIDGWVANGIRYPFAALLYMPWLIAFHRKGQLTRHHWRLALWPAIINTLSQILWAWTPYFIDPGFISFLVRLSTVWTVLGSFLLFRDERRLVRSAKFWVGFALALAGFVLMTLAGGVSLSARSVTGILLVVFTSLGWAGYQLSVRKNMQNVDSRLAFGTTAALTSLGLIGCMFMFGDTAKALELPLDIMMIILLSGMIGIAAAHLLFYVAIKRIGVAIASGAGLSSAFVTAVFSRWLFHEKLIGLQWLAGAGIIFGGIILTSAQAHLRRNT